MVDCVLRFNRNISFLVKVDEETDTIVYTPPQYRYLLGKRADNIAALLEVNGGSLQEVGTVPPMGRDCHALAYVTA